MKPLLDRVKDARAAVTAAGDQLDAAARDKLTCAPRYELDKAARDLGIDPLGLRHDQVVDRVMEALS